MSLSLNWAAFGSGLISTCRCCRLAFDLIQYWGYWQHTGIQVKHQTRYTAEDVTVLIITLGTEPALISILREWLRYGPGQIIVTTTEAGKALIADAVESIGDERIQMHALPQASAREQMIKNIESVRTDLALIADDRTYPSPQLLHLVANAFSDPSVGGITVPRNVVPSAGKPRLSIWESFGALNQTRRRILHAALAYLHNGQVLNLSGGSSAVRTAIVQQNAFYHALRHETWRSRYRIVTGDDNALTRFIVQGGWRTGFLNVNEARVDCTVCADANYVRQVTRWSRDTARSYLRDVAFAFRSGCRRVYVHAALNIAANYASDAEVLVELAILMAETLFGGSTADARLAARWLEHFLIASAFTFLEHLPFFNRPARLLYLPGAIVYMYLHAFIVLWACLTLHKSTWDSRPELKASH